MKKTLATIIMVITFLASDAQIEEVTINNRIIQLKVVNGQRVTYIPTAGAPTSTSGKYNILFMGDGFIFENQDAFDNVVQLAINGMLSKAPFSANASAFNFYRINVVSPSPFIGVPVNILTSNNNAPVNISARPGNTALDTRYGDNEVMPFAFTFSTAPELIHGLADNVLPTNNAVVVISFTFELNTRGLNVYGITFMGLNDVGNTLPHEMGHQIGRLGDEYTDNFFPVADYAGCEPSFVNVTLCSNINTCTPTDNCGSSRAAKINNWANLMGANTPEQKASLFENLYRPQSNCFMRATGANTNFCPVCSAELVKNFCPPPKPPHIRAGVISSQKYIEIPRGYRHFSPPDAETQLIEVDISINYLYEDNYALTDCSRSVKLTALGEPTATYSWFKVKRNPRGIISYIPIPSNAPSRPDQCSVFVADTTEIACRQTVNNCVSDYRIKMLIPENLWFRDADHDGYSTGPGIRKCGQPELDFVISSRIVGHGDCRDDERNINPGATEKCDAIDNNCNLQIDEGHKPITPSDIEVDGGTILNGTTIFCSGVPVTLRVIGGSLGAATDWQWFACTDFNSSSQCDGDLIPIGFGSEISVSPAQSTLYIVTATACNEMVSKKRIIQVRATPDSRISVSRNPVCYGEGTRLQQTEQPPPSLNIYSWTGPNNFTQLAVSGSDAVDIPVSLNNLTQAQSGIYTLTVSNEFGCTSSSSVTLVVRPEILENRIETGDQLICAGNIPQILTGSTPTGANSFIYSWYQSTDNIRFELAAGEQANRRQRDYSPPALTQTMYYSRYVGGGGCNSLTSRSNTVKITVISGAGIIEKIEGPGPACAQAASNYFAVAPNGQTFQWSISGGHQIESVGPNATITWNGTSLEAATISVNVTDCEGTTRLLQRSVTRLPCIPSVEIGCRLPGDKRSFCDIRLDAICSRLGLTCINDCSRSVCASLRNWRFFPEDRTTSIRVELIASMDPRTRPIRIISTSTYARPAKLANLLNPGIVNLKPGEMLWLRFTPLTNKKNNKINVLFVERP